MAKVKVELSIPSGLKSEPIIYYISHHFKIIPNIIEASFSTEMGWALLTLEGGQEELDRLFEYLKSKNVTIKSK